MAPSASSEAGHAISVVIPNYNYGHFVAEAIESALSQTHRPLEVIVVDDGSTDNSVEVIRKFDAPVRLIEQANQHLSAARNTGIRAAKGDWIAVLDADDVWHPRKLEFQVAGLRRHPEWGFVGAKGITEDESYPDLEDEVSQMPDLVRRVSVREFLTFTPMSGSDALIQRECFDAVGFFDENLRSSEDRDMWLRLAARFSGGVVTRACWRVRRHRGQMSRNVSVMNTTRQRVLQRFFTNHPERVLPLWRVTAAAHFYDCALAHRDDAGNNVRSLLYGVGSLMVAPESYHEDATTKERALSVLVTAARLVGIQRFDDPARK